MPTRFDLVTLDLFVAVVEEQSISRAAEREHIATSAISRRISDLETLLRVDLFTRHSKGIELTAAGLALLRHARAVRAQLGQMEAELHEYEQGLRGLVRVAANKSAVLQSLPADLGVFMTRHPMVRIELEETTSPLIVRAVTEGTADIGIFGANIPAPDLHILPYREDVLAVVLPAGHAFAGRPGVAFADIADCDFVCLQKDSSIDTLCRHAAERIGRTLRTRVRVSAFDAQLRMIEARMGIGIVPLQAALRAPGAIEHLPLEEPWARRPLHLCVRALDGLPVAGRLLVEQLVAAPAVVGQGKSQGDEQRDADAVGQRSLA